MFVGGAATADGAAAVAVAAALPVEVHNIGSPTITGDEMFLSR